jgi:SAM-dependent methyltransferase
MRVIVTTAAGRWNVWRAHAGRLPGGATIRTGAPGTAQLLSTIVKRARESMTTIIDPTRSWVSPTGNHYWYRKRREVGRLLETRAQLAAGAKVVDLGGGTGEDIPLLSSLYPGADILALDAAQEDLDKFDARYAEVEGVRSQFADITERLPLDDDSVDLVYCSEVMEHIPDAPALFREVHRVLRPGGYFLMTTKNEPNVLQKSFWLKRRVSTRVPGAGDAHENGNIEIHGHITLFKIREWERELERCGFRLEAARRGALMYGARRWLDSEAMLALYFTAEALLDLVPVRYSRRISDQLIGLYRKV